MAYSYLNYINIGKVSTYLANSNTAKGVLFGGRIYPNLPTILAMETDSVNWIYEYDNTDSTLTETTAYLYALCGKYAVQAIPLVTGGGSSSGGTTPQIIKSPIPITGADFATSTAWNGTNSDGITIRSTYTLQIFWNDIQRFLQEGTEWNRTSSGFNITASGFDATANPDYSLYVYISL